MNCFYALATLGLFLNGMVCPNTEYRTFQDKIAAYVRGEIARVSDFVKLTEPKDWNTLDLAAIKRWDSLLNELSRDTSGNIPPRIKDLLDVARVSPPDKSANFQDLVTKLRASNTESKKQQIISLMPAPDKLTLSEIGTLNNDITKLGLSYIVNIGINDPEVRKELYVILMRNMNSGTDEEKAQMKRTIGQMIRKDKNRDISFWTTKDFDEIDLFQFLSMDMCMKANKEVTHAKKTDIINALSSLQNTKLSRACLKRILENENLDDETDANKVWEMVNNLNTLRNELLHEDIKSKEIRKNTNIKSLLERNLKVALKKGPLSPMTGKILTEEMMDMDEITATYLNQMGKEVLAFAPPLKFKKVVEAGLITSLDIGDIAKALMLNGGLGQKAKVRVLAKEFEKTNINNNNPNFRSLTPLLVREISASLLKNAPESDWRNFMENQENQGINKAYNLPPPMAQIAMNKITSFSTNIPMETKPYVSILSMNKMGDSNLRQFTKNLPSFTTAALRNNEKTFGPITTITSSNILSLKDSLSTMNYNTTGKIDQEDIVNFLNAITPARGSDSIHSVTPSLDANIGLKNLMVKYAMENYENVNDCSGLLAKMIVYDIEHMPIGVLAACGPDALNQLKRDEAVTAMLLFGLEKNAHWKVTPQSGMAIVGNGLKHMRMNNKIGLMPGDMQMVGYGVAYLPADEITNADPLVLPEVVQKLIEVIQMRIQKLCLDNNQRSAIAMAIKQLKGSDTSKWTDASDVACFLSYLPFSDLDKMKVEVFLSAECELMENSYFDKLFKILCETAIMSDYDSMIRAEEELEKLKSEKAQKYMQDLRDNRENKPSIPDAELVCEDAMVTEVENIENSRVESLTPEEVMDCLYIFGKSSMEEDHATTLFQKVKGYIGNIRLFNKSVIQDSGNILTGLTMSEYRNLPFANDQAVMETLGKINFREAQGRQVLTEVTAAGQQQKSTENWKLEDIALLYKLLCRLDYQDIVNINTDMMQEAQFFKNLAEECEFDDGDSKKDDFFKGIFKQGSIAFGSAEAANWEASELSEVDGAAAWFTPEQLLNMDEKTGAGLTPMGINNMDGDRLRAFKLAHYLNFHPATIQALTDDQWSDIPSDVVDELMDNKKQIFTKYTRRGKGVSCYQGFDSILVLVLAFLTMQFVAFF